MHLPAINLRSSYQQTNIEMVILWLMKMKNVWFILDSYASKHDKNIHNYLILSHYIL